MSRGWPFLLVALVASANAEASQRPEQGAPTPPPSVAPPGGIVPAEPEVSYGWQTLLVDAAGVSAGLAIAYSPLRTEPRDPPTHLATVAGATYLVGVTLAPSVHFANGRKEAAFTSLGVRALFPPIAALLGSVSYCTARGRYNRECHEDGLVAGSLAGLATVAAVDALVLSKGDRDGHEGKRWYGWQTATVDAFGLAFGGYIAQRTTHLSDRIGAPLRVGLGLYTVGFFGGPLVHFVNGRVGMGFASFGVRVVGPAVFMLTGVMGYCAAAATDRCARTGSEAAFLGGTILAAVFDATVLAWKQEEAPATSLRVVPTLAFDRGGATLGFAAAL